MSTDHTSGLLIFRQIDGSSERHEIEAVSGYHIAETIGGLPEGVDEANARRLVACWNACHGVDTEALEHFNANSNGLPFVKGKIAECDVLLGDAGKLSAQRDECFEPMLALLQDWKRAGDNGCSNEEWEAILTRRNELLTKAENGPKA